MKYLSLIACCIHLLPWLPAWAGEVPLLTDEGFSVPQPGATLEFPHDHGSHPDFKIEWWYLTGHLHAQSGERFGYQATFFRRALKTSEEDHGQKDFGDGQLFLAHMALTDAGTGRFYFEERLNREGWDAYAQVGTLDLRNGNWTLRATDEDVSAIQLQASVRADVSWTLRLEAEKPLVRFGEDGTSRKGASPESRSYYISFTRLKTSGTVTIGERQFNVAGLSWMDHEIASSQLEAGYTGWDWVAIQLADGWEVKAYLLRMSDGSTSPFSALIWIAPDGTTYPYGPSRFTWDAGKLWSSPTSEARYPINPVIQTQHPLTGETATFRIEPLLQDQELTLPGTTYWEGAGRVLDEQGVEVGSSYLELVGYGGQIEGLE